MQKDMLGFISDGQSYRKLWPLKKELASLFVEYRVIKATNLAINVLPMLAAMSIMVQITYLGTEYMPQALAGALFLLSMPMQGLYWLGKRSNTPLPLSMAHWYHKIHQQMAEEGCQPPKGASNPRYRELAELLKHAYEKMDKAFTKDMF